MSGVDSLYTDADFPPTISSIDGSSSTVEVTPSCTCGRGARLREVAKDGPSQGRQFWCCATGTPAQGGCGFFAWCKGAPHKASDLALTWVRLRPAEGYRVVGPSGCRAADVQQGSVGDCWFLAALAVVAERPALVSRLLLDHQPSERGMYRVQLFIDGGWRTFELDDYFPVKPAATKADSSRRMAAAADSARVAFSKCAGRQLWAGLIEKAYARAHGSYRAISGGWVAEALFDLTGCPTETLWLSGGGGESAAACRDALDPDTAWARLLSFTEHRFLMGASCPASAKGLVRVSLRSSWPPPNRQSPASQWARDRLLDGRRWDRTPCIGHVTAADRIARHVTAT